MLTTVGISQITAWSFKFTVSPWYNSDGNGSKGSINCYHQPLKNYRQPTNNYRQPTNNYRQPINNYRQPINKYRQPINNYRQPINNYQKPLNNYQKLRKLKKLLEMLFPWKRQSWHINKHIVLHDFNQFNHK